MDKKAFTAFLSFILTILLKKYEVKKMKLANKQFSKSVQEEARKFETKILDLKGKRREEAMKAYRRFLLSSTEQPIYFTRS